MKGRVFFYSKTDGAIYINMQMAEKVLDNFSSNNNYNINDIIELYHVKKHIDNDIFLTKWTEEDKNKIKNKCSLIWSVIVRFWNQINSSNVLVFLQQLEGWHQHSTFWELTNNLSTFKNIDRASFYQILNKTSISNILNQEKIVKYYDDEIRNYLLSYNKSAELILQKYTEKGNTTELYFPKSLTKDNYEKIILDYIDYDNANLNYISLILNTHKQDKLEFSDKTKLKAQRRKKELNDKFFKENNSIKSGFKISLNNEQVEPIKISREDNIIIYSYGTKYLTQTDNKFFNLINFQQIFYYTNFQGCISLVNKGSDFSTFEKHIGLKSKKEYIIGEVFKHKNELSLAQIYLYDNLLINEKNYNVEDIIENYIKNTLSQEFSLSNIRFNSTSKGSNSLEKIRSLLAEFDALLRQYKMLKEDGEIDIELLCMSSKPYSFSDITSFVNNKYYYLKSNELNYVFHLLFSDQSGLTTQPSIKEWYNNFYDLLKNDKVLYEVFYDFQKEELNFLIEKEYLFIDNDGYLQIKDNDKLFILEQLYKEEVLSYWHYSNRCRCIINDMTDNGILYFENTLFNKLECSYLNYYFNNKEYTNSYALRNKFQHGTNSDAENELLHSYYITLKIIILTLLKIDDDQSIKRKIDKGTLLYYYKY